jgi:D-Tyr-tRNAtyr deacylase
MLVLPEPFGPVKTENPSCMGMDALRLKDLKPCITNLSSFTMHAPRQKAQQCTFSDARAPRRAA